jgi:VanZ family protein
LFEYLEKRKVILVYVPLAVYWIALFVGTSMPSMNVPSFTLNDKLVHFTAFFILAFLLSLSILYQNKYQILKNFYIVSAFIISSLYGLIDEFHQIFIPGRSSDILDWTADSAGALAGVLIVSFLLKRFRYFKSKTKEFEQ